MVTLWRPPTAASLVEGLDPEQIDAIKKAVEAGQDREYHSADAWAGKAVADVLGLDLGDDAHKAKARATLAALTKAGHFKKTKRADPSAKGRMCPCLVPVDPGDMSDGDD